MKQFKFVDLFCGIGGFHIALTQLGGKCVFASDIDADCRKVYLDNFGIEPYGDITKVDEKDIPEHDLLCGGFPCQSFSKAGNRKGINDPRGTLFFDIVRIVKHHKPKYILLENVRNLAGHDGGNTWKTIHYNLRHLGYNVSPEPIIYSPHYLGVPQHRERVFIACVRKDIGDLPFLPVKPAKYKISNALSIIDSNSSNFRKYKLNKSDESIIDLWNEFIQNIKGDLPGFPVWADYFDMVVPPDEFNLYPKWKQSFILKNKQLYEANSKFLTRWLLKARKNSAFKGAKAKFEWQAGKTANPNLWDTIMHFRPSGLRAKAPTHFPALVAITQTSIVGPLKRRLTPRECARLQSFPDTFKIHPTDRIAYRQFGNSVNVEVVKLFANFLINTRSYFNQET
ncbi:MAG TPA: DNA cytosine methyltransferase [Tenuifilaceae bacterium]|mgnify:FL=1|nr:DNA cytosine methyltransferase [Tenuifilaceae bacterium]HPI46337.1 DNA cytosine methyltransferase [Tenuifilaceae bacterium]HPN23141.1 DNA cytosine methyltransferase [Tenuifilaceae bacterium]